MSQPPPGEVSITGKVLDTSALAVWTEGLISLRAWVGVARARGLTLLLPTLARVEILTLRPEAAGLVGELTAHPHVLIAELSGSDREAIEARIAASETCDVLATWVVHASHQRGWPALSGDPTRLRRVDPTVEIDLL